VETSSALPNTDSTRRLNVIQAPSRIDGVPRCRPADRTRPRRRRSISGVRDRARRSALNRLADCSDFRRAGNFDGEKVTRCATVVEDVGLADRRAGRRCSRRSRDERSGSRRSAPAWRDAEDPERPDLGLSLRLWVQQLGERQRRGLPRLRDGQAWPWRRAFGEARRGSGCDGVTAPEPERAARREPRQAGRTAAQGGCTTTPRGVAHAGDSANGSRDPGDAQPVAAAGDLVLVLVRVLTPACRRRSVPGLHQRPAPGRDGDRGPPVGAEGQVCEVAVRRRDAG